jgi:hypothetical protein
LVDKPKADHVLVLWNDLETKHAPKRTPASASRLGDKDRAFELIEKALAVKNDRLLFIKVDPRFDNLRGDERYERLLSRMNLPR